MDNGRDAQASARPAGIDETEWALRLELAVSRPMVLLRAVTRARAAELRR